jgi:hypothetical protein
MGYLSDVAQRRIAALLLVAAIAVGALAVADVGPFSDPPTQEERAQDAVERFFTAARDKDFKAVCDQLTNQEQRTIEQRAGAIAARQGLKGCAEILEALLGKQLGASRIDKFDEVSVSGNQARVEAELRTPGAKHPRPATFQLFLVRGEWRIADFSA